MALQGTNRSRRRTRLAAIGLGLLGWVALIVVATGPRASSSNWIGLPDVSDLVGAIMIGLVILGAFVMIEGMRTPAGPLPQRRRRRSIGTMLGILGVVLVLYWVNPDFLRQFQIEDDETELGTAPEIPEALEEVAELERPLVQIEQWHVAVALAVVVLGLAVFAWLKRREARIAADRLKLQTGDAEMAALLDNTMRLLTDSDDPRTAVLVAYASLEQALAEQGRRRRSSETSAEHLRRVLSSGTIDPAPLIELGRLYHLARFSDHVIEAADRDRAVASLDDARQHLMAGTRDQP